MEKYCKIKKIKELNGENKTHTVATNESTDVVQKK